MEAPANAVYEITVDDKYKCYLKEIDRETYELVLGLIMPTNGQPKYVLAGEIILNRLWVGGDDIVKTQDDLLVSAAMAAYKLIDIKGSDLKKISKTHVLTNKQAKQER